MQLGIDPAASLAASTWVLSDGGVPVASGKCDVLPEMAQTPHIASVPPFWVVAVPGMKYGQELTAAIIERIHGAVYGRDTKGLFDTAFTAGLIAGILRERCNDLPIYSPPRSEILSNFVKVSRAKGADLDRDIALELQRRGLCKVEAHKRLTVTGNEHLRTVDQRDSFVASIWEAQEQWRVK